MTFPSDEVQVVQAGSVMPSSEPSVRVAQDVDESVSGDPTVNAAPVAGDPTAAAGDPAAVAQAAAASGIDVQGKTTDQLLKMMEPVQAQISQLANIVGKVATPQAAPAQAATKRDYAAELTDLTTRLEAGELSTSQFAASQAKILSDQLGEQFSAIHQEELNKVKMNTTAEKATEKFLNDNPDFEATLSSDEAKSILSSNPLYDQVAAYERVKRLSSNKELEATKSQLALIQKQLDDAVRNGAVKTDLVGKDSGTQVRTIVGQKKEKPKQFNKAEAQSGGLAALAAARKA